MKALKQIKSIFCAGIFIFYLTLSFSCNPPRPTGPISSNTMQVEISNPEWNTPIGFPGSQQGFGPGFEVEVIINTLNSANQATLFSTKTLTIANISSAPSNVLIIKDVTIPSSGAYTIQYTLKSLNCTWPQTGNLCNRPGIGSASKKYFKDQVTMPTGGNPGSYFFNCTIANRYNEICC